MFGLPTHRRTTAASAAAARPAAAALEPLESRQLLSASSLTLVLNKSTLPPAQISGATLKGAVTVSVTNGATTTVSGQQIFNVYGSPDGTIDATSIVLGTVVRKNFVLGGAKTTKLTIPVKTAAPAVGDYSIYIEAVDASGNTSVAGKAPDVSVAAPYVSLVATAITPKFSNLIVNHVETITVTIVNNGNISSTKPLSAALELSTDGTVVSAALGTSAQVRGVSVKEGGKAVKLTYAVKIPDTGTYFIGASFTAGSDTFTTFSTSPVLVLSNVR